MLPDRTMASRAAQRPEQIIVKINAEPGHAPVRKILLVLEQHRIGIGTQFHTLFAQVWIK